jgi:hypothetical protein
MTEKSARHMSHVDEPNDGPSAAAAMGVSRMRLNCVGSLPRSCPMPREPIASGRRAPVDSPTTTSGMPRSVAVRFMCATFLLLVALVDAPLTVKSLTTIATSRPSILP